MPDDRGNETHCDVDERTQLIPNAADGSTRDGSQQELKYPKSIHFIVGFEFFERYSHYTFQTILAVYANLILGYSDDASTTIYHLYIFTIYLFPVAGSILAEGWIGNYRTTLYFSLIYLIGNVIITLGSAADVVHFDARWASFIGLLLNAVGTGVIKPCVSTLGGEQFTLPQHQSHLDRFFSLFILVINLASLLAMFASPVLRHDVTCLGQTGCYPLAYGVATVAMALAILVFLIGTKKYKIRQPEGNVLVEVSKCIWYGMRAQRREKRDHWLDHADGKYDVALISDIKATLKVLMLFIPIPMFWALFLQIGSRWTLQATRMDGDMGLYTVKPEQVMVLNSVLMIAFIPLFDACLYPLLGRCRVIRRPLQRIGVGMMFAALAFALCALVEFKLEPTYAAPPAADEGQLRLYNGYNCSMTLNLELTPGNMTSVNVSALEAYNMLHLPFADTQSRDINATVTSRGDCQYQLSWSGNLTVTRQQSTSYLMTYVDQTTGSFVLRRAEPFDDLDKSFTGNPKIKLIYNFLKTKSPTKSQIVTLIDTSDVTKRVEFVVRDDACATNTSEIDPGKYHVTRGNESVSDVTLSEGGVYVLLVQEQPVTRQLDGRAYVITPANSVPMYWLIPQHAAMTVGEVMVSVTGLTFAFTQAPARMKTVLTSAWLISVSFGNMIVILVAQINVFSRQAYEFLLFAGLMVITVIIFALLTVKYTYVDYSTRDQITNNTIQNNKTMNEVGLPHITNNDNCE